MPNLTLFDPQIPAHSVPILTFDGTFEGWLTAVFCVYENQWQNQSELQIVTDDDFTPSLWQQRFEVAMDSEKAERVGTKLLDLMGKKGIKQLLWAFLSEQPDVYTAMFWLVAYQIENPKQNVWEHYTHPAVMQVSKLIKMVGRERHRMQAFVRFEHTIEGIYFARINPDFNVLPIVADHFVARYADQDWAIYDVIRGYGIFYQKDKSDEGLQLIDTVSEDFLQKPESLHSEQERQYQTMWQRYFTSVNIKERFNPKLHKQMLPKRYWRYLTEKMI